MEMPKGKPNLECTAFRHASVRLKLDGLGEGHVLRGDWPLPNRRCAPNVVEADVRRHGTNILGFRLYVVSLQVSKGGTIRRVDIDPRAREVY